jgi:DNA processing protein
VSNLPQVLLAAALLRVPARRLRALAAGDEGALRDWLANESATRLAEARRDSRAAFARLGELDARVVPVDDPDYPAGLRDLRDAPAFLIVRGALSGASGPEGVAIVGSRDAHEQARSFARALAARVAEPVVSGLARGIDAAAHEGALAAGRRTLAYVAHGFGATFPPENAELEDRIVAAGGAALSERLPDEPVASWALVKRDRLQAAHAWAVVLVQSELKGGAMHTMRFACELGRARFALEPREGSNYDGNCRALEDGARMIPWDVEEAVCVLDRANREKGNVDPAPRDAT